MEEIKHGEIKGGYQQEPMAIVGFACRLPGGNDTPWKLWSFLERGDVAQNQVPESRFNVSGHYDGSEKPGTMRPPGGMFLGDDIDLAAFDAAFFEISGLEAIAMDPNQRQMLEVVVEGLESAGIPLQKLSGAPIACFVGSYASDYADIHSRDPEDRPANYPIGVGRAILANRISYCLNIKGPSITIDTACSGSLVGIDLACRIIQSGQVNAAIVAASNLYLNPEHVIDIGTVGQAHSPTALCHTFDASADGYVKAEAVSCVIIKRLTDAIRDRDPVRAIIRGSASTSNGRTGGIASPNWSAQAAAIRTAYANAGILSLNDTAYLECHGTGTPAGDYAEVKGAGAVFAPDRPVDKPLIIGSIKSNIGHSEPAAGISGLIKTVLAMETGIIPGTPLFKVPNPEIDFEGNKVMASRTAIPWPVTNIRRASINSFGFGGSNAHAIVEQADVDIRRRYHCSYNSTADRYLEAFEGDNNDEDGVMRPYLLLVSANDATSLDLNLTALSTQLSNPRVNATLSDLAYTLSERRSRFWHRAFLTTSNIEFSKSDFTISNTSPGNPRIGYAFTGQGSQWPTMGNYLLQYFPLARSILEELDQVLQATRYPPSWSLISELTEARPVEYIRRAEISQPLITALQLCIIAILEDWNIRPSSVLGHSSGEIAAAHAAGFIDRRSAIKAAFYRGQAAANCKAHMGSNLGMLAVGLSAENIATFLTRFKGRLWIACFNSPNSLTISGRTVDLEVLKDELIASGYFARLLHVELAYHSPLVEIVGEEYMRLLNEDGDFTGGQVSVLGATMVSTTTASELATKPDAPYWMKNMISPVLFQQALEEMVSLPEPPNILIEIGPSGALAGPIAQTLKSLPSVENLSYHPAWSRGSDASKSLFNLAGHLYNAGSNVNVARVNNYNESVRTIVDLPNYQWNHSVRYWHENKASRHWRFKKFPTHDLIGSKTLNSSWNCPTWHKQLVLEDVPWLRDHRMGSDILVPGAGFVTMALEAMYQKHSALRPDVPLSPNDLCYRFKNVRFERALVVEEDKRVMLEISLSPIAGSKDWHEFSIRTTNGDLELQHCMGLVCVQKALQEVISGADLEPLRLATSAKLWYKAQREIGMGFGPAFQRIQSIEATSGKRSCRTLVSLTPPKSKWNPQSYYPFHPAVLDGMLQTATPANACGDRSTITDVMVPSMVDDLIINQVPSEVYEGLSVATSEYSGRGRPDAAKSWVANITIRDSKTGATFLNVRRLRYTRLDVNLKTSPHSFSSTFWKPEISLLPQDKLLDIYPGGHVTKLDFVIDLISHKTPQLSVLELNLDQTDESCLWFQVANFAARTAYSKYSFVSSNAESLIRVQEQYQAKMNTSFFLTNSQHESFGLPEALNYDLVIVKFPNATRSSIKAILKRLPSLTKSNAFIILIASKDTVGSAVDTRSLLPDTSAEAEELLDCWGLKQQLERVDSISHIYDIESGLGRRPIYLGRCAESRERVNGLDDSPRHINILLLGEVQQALISSISAVIENAGWVVTQCTEIPKVLNHKTIIVVLDELSHARLKHANSLQWETFKGLLSSRMPVLWVTKGAQIDVTNPDFALVHGIFRVVRREDPSVRLTSLDLSAAPGAMIPGQAILQVLDQIRCDEAEEEYAEHDGVLHISRVMRDTAMNAFRRSEEEGTEPISRDLFETQKRVQLLAERVGTLEMAWHETDMSEVPKLENGWIEVEVMAAGVNFKDVATAMGIVPENEHTLGCECAGVVKRIGEGSSKFRLGDRVVIMRSATFANRCRAPETRAHAIPSWMNFEDAATIPVAYVTSVYSMLWVGNLGKGQSVLIHSAAGGVGLAAIHVARYKNAEIYATVGTDEKRQYLTDNLGIPPDRIFSSRSTDFADKIIDVTNGRGVDLVLNSLTGDLLEASWKVCASGGKMVEIGKKDIVDRNKLDMEPFERNCSFHAVDVSYTKVITDTIIERLLQEVFDLIERSHIKPIRPISLYGFDAIPDALVRLRSGKQIGKIVISRMNRSDMMVPIKPPIRSLHLKPTCSYLIIGGLQGLCGSLAVHMAQHGARHIIAYSRGGSKDLGSAQVIQDCASYGCCITIFQNDIRDLEAVKQVVNSANPPIRGVIQGAMILRDKPFETMSIDDFHAITEVKVQGTWNVHQALQDTGNQELDFFTMLSSVSGVAGNKGQANYAAANTFLDAFARYRQEMGLPANTIDLGLVEDVGYVAKRNLEGQLGKSEWTPLNERMLRKVFSYSIMQQERGQPINMDSSAQLITGIAYPLGRSISDLAAEARFAYLGSANDNAGVANPGEGNEGSSQLDQAVRAFLMLQASGHETSKLVTSCVEFLATQVTRILRLETAVEPDKPLIAYGLDSLSAVELRNWILMKLGAELSSFDITNAASLTALSEKLVSKMPSIADK